MVFILAGGGKLGETGAFFYFFLCSSRNNSVVDVNRISVLSQHFFGEPMFFINILGLNIGKVLHGTTVPSKKYIEYDKIASFLAI